MLKLEAPQRQCRKAKHCYRNRR